MYKCVKTIVGMAASLSVCSSFAQNVELDKRVKGLVDQMTLDEKIQMITKKKGWSYGGCERLGIPTWTCHDGPHGVRRRVSKDSGGKATAFPTTAGRGASFDRDLAYRIAECEAREFRAFGNQMRLGNCIDLNRHPAYGRASESAGEDPYLVSEIGVAGVKGTQDNHLIANLKHFMLNTREDKATRKNNFAVIDERSLLEMYGMSFKECIDRANAWSIMTAHSRVNGLHSSVNPYVQNTILRDYWGFRYFVLNDWSSVKDVIRQEEGNVADVINSGHDVETCTKEYAADLAKHVTDGDVTMERLDEAVSRVLRVMFLSGMMTGQPAADPADVGCLEHQAICREGGRKSIVLLKNEDNILPLKKSGSIALIGPNVIDTETDSRASGHVFPMYVVDVLQGIKNVAPQVKINYAKGCGISTDDKSGFAAALEAAKQSDIVLFVGGLDQYEVGEGIDRTGNTCHLPGVQEELINELAKVNPNVVVVLHSGNMVAIENSHDSIKGLMFSFFPGMEVGNSMADLLFGDYTPSAKLPVTMPLNDSQLPPFTDDHHDHIVKVGYRWFDYNNLKPLYAFGHGLSYTTFGYDNIRISSDNTTADTPITVEVDVTNTGKREGTEVVQLYISDLEASVLMAKKQLKGFERVTLQPGETKTVPFTITAKELSFWDVKSKRFIVEQGAFKIMVGGASDKLPLKADLTITNNYTVPKVTPMAEVLPEPVENTGEAIVVDDGVLRVQLEKCSKAQGTITIGKDAGADQGRYLTGLNNGDWLRYEYINMGSWLNTIDLRYAADQPGGEIEFRLDAPDGKFCGKLALGVTDGKWKTTTVGTSDYGVSGNHHLYIIYRGDAPCKLDWWELEGEIETPQTNEENLVPRNVH